MLSSNHHPYTSSGAQQILDLILQVRGREEFAHLPLASSNLENVTDPVLINLVSLDLIALQKEYISCLESSSTEEEEEEEQEEEKRERVEKEEEEVKEISVEFSF
jgi:hypothetical protein